MFIDLNCDLGESAGHDAELLRLITTANVCCGAHAGDAETSHLTIAAAVYCGVRVGAHPGYPDREHFGRRDLVMRPRQIYAECLHQIGALAALAKDCGTTLSHVKPHGALYNQAVRDATYAEPIVAAAQLFDLPIMGLPGSHLERLSAGRFVPEGFADRRYRPDGTLVPRSEPTAMLTDPAEAANQAMELVRARGVRTLCVHGDSPHALAFVRELRAALTGAGFTIRAFA